MKSRNYYVGLSVYSTVFEILEYFFIMIIIQSAQMAALEQKSRVLSNDKDKPLFKATSHIYSLCVHTIKRDYTKEDIKKKKKVR